MDIQDLQQHIIEKLRRLNSEDVIGESSLYDKGLENKDYWENDGESAYEWGFNLGEEEGERKVYKKILDLLK